MRVALVMRYHSYRSFVKYGSAVSDAWDEEATYSELTNTVPY